ncbi:MAG: VWA domain-containing protein [Anaerolineae bacterium]|nr:VWA domain-containing protein [Anaerolineae bacterium]MDQ7035114.1 VWA domain-containing protein [Anaerolineae bacterium]
MRANFSLDYDVITVEQAQKLYLMARFEAEDIQGDRVRRPLNISLVIDRSGSMAGDKIDFTKQAAQFLVQHLGSQDVLSIVLYNDKVETLFPPEQISNKDRVSQLLDEIRIRGTTNLSGGWLEGCQHVKSRLADNTLNRVILMTDGLANRGVTDASMLVSMTKQKREEGVSTTTMGLGKDFDEDLLMDMATGGGGAYYFIESPEVAPVIFQEELSGLLRVVGQNLTITVTPTSHVSSVHQLHAYPISTDGKASTYRLGDIFGNEVKTLMLELSIPAMADLGEEQIATLRFEYDEISGETTQHHINEMSVMVNVKSEIESPSLPNKEVAQSVLLLKAAQARQEAVTAADKGHYEAASGLLREVANSIDASQIINNELKEERDALIEQAKKMEKGATGYDDYSRKTMSTQAFFTRTNRHDDTMMLRHREQQREAANSNRVPQDANDLARKTLHKPTKAIHDHKEEILRLPGIVPTHVQWKDKTFLLKGDIIRLGRSSHNEIVLDERGVSRWHGQIKREGDKLLLEDLGSTNGTTIDGEQIEGIHELSVGDVVYLCDERLVFLGNN